MPFFFWFGQAINFFTLVIALATLLVVIWLGPRRPANLTLALYLLALSIWTGISILLRLSLYIPQLALNSQTLLEITTGSFGVLGLAILLFTLTFYHINSRTLWGIVLGGFLLYSWQLGLLLDGRLAYDSVAWPNGQFTFTISPVGYVHSSSIFVYMLISIGVIWQQPDRRQHWSLLTGLVILFLSGVIGIFTVNIWPAPIFTVGFAISTLFITYAILRQQLFNPLLQLNQELETKVATRTAELADSMAVQSHYQSELTIAREIQLSLLPHKPPILDNFELYGRSLLAEEVGGDFYSYYMLPYNRLSLAVGDVSGKGIPAALLMALSMNSFEILAERHHDQGGLLGNLNEFLSARLQESSMNIALLCVLLDGLKREARIANAGLIAPFLWREGHVSEIDVSGLPLGSSLTDDYFERTVSLKPGDRLLLVSDGIVEAMNQQHQMFGFDCLEEVLCQHGGQSPEALVEAVLAAVKSHTGSADLHDDMTVVAIGVR